MMTCLPVVKNGYWLKCKRLSISLNLFFLSEIGVSFAITYVDILSISHMDK